MRTWQSDDKKDGFFDEEAAAECRAERSASVKTEMAISLLELDCMRYSVNRDETLTVLDLC